MKKKNVRVGVRVFLKEGSKWVLEDWVDETNPVDVQGTIIMTYPKRSQKLPWIEVQWDNGETNQYHPKDLRRVKKTKLTKAIEEMAQDLGIDLSEDISEKVEEFVVHLPETITRLVLVDQERGGRVYDSTKLGMKLVASLQDDGRTLKLFWETT